MSVKMTIIKHTADGEQLSIEAEVGPEFIPSEGGLRGYLDPYFRLMDDRLMELNKRIIASNYMVKKLPTEAQMAMHNIMDVLHGHKPGPAIEEIIVEAADDLEKRRVQAEAKKEALLEGETRPSKRPEPTFTKNRPVQTGDDIKRKAGNGRT